MIPRFSLALLLAMALIPGAIRGEEDNTTGEIAKETTGKNTKETTGENAQEKEDDWLQYYYQDPQPERLVDEVKTWASDGTLKNQHAIPVIVAFLSQVFRQNRDKIDDWYQDLAGLTDSEKMVIHTAMAFSRTKEADKIMNGELGNIYEKQKEQFPKILEKNLAQPDSLGMLWGFFYATGSRSAIRRVIWAFRFEDAPKNPEFAKVPKDHKPFYTELPNAAAYTLRSHALKHPKVLEACIEIFKTDEELSPVERRRLGALLDEVKGETPVVD